MAAHPIGPPMTAGEFMRLYGEEDENRHELIDGVVYERPLNGFMHDMVKNNLKELFDRAGVGGHGFKCWIEHSFRVSQEAIPIPDLAIFRVQRPPYEKRNSPTAGAPEIAMEVATNDSSIVLQRKISAYLRNGAVAVCCVYPDLRTITIYTAHEWRELRDGDNLEFPALLPGISIPVSAVFEDMEAQAPL